MCIPIPFAFPPNHVPHQKFSTPMILFIIQIQLIRRATCKGVIIPTALPLHVPIYVMCLCIGTVLPHDILSVIYSSIGNSSVGSGRLRRYVVILPRLVLKSGLGAGAF
jgi:hypothetical protein